MNFLSFLNYNNINILHVWLQQQSLNLTFNDIFSTLLKFFFLSKFNLHKFELVLNLDLDWDMCFRKTNIFLLPPQIICISYSSSDNRDQGG